MPSLHSLPPPMGYLVMNRFGRNWRFYRLSNGRMSGSVDTFPTYEAASKAAHAHAQSVSKTLTETIFAVGAL